MTEAEIMKALECCSKVVDEGCGECPMYEKDCNEVSLEKLAIDLINLKNADIERLKRLVDYKCHMDIKMARAEAVKEFAERVNKLIDMCFYDLGDFDDNMSMKTDVDQIAKEMGVEL